MSMIANILNMGSVGKKQHLSVVEIPMQILRKHGYINVNEKLLWNNTGREELYSMLPVELAVLIKKVRALIALEDDSAAFVEKLNEFTPEQKQELIDIGYLQEEPILSAQEPADVEETVSSAQEPADDNAKEETAPKKEKATVEELIKRFLTKELVEELESEVCKLPKTASLDSFKKEIIKVLCKHIKPPMVADSAMVADNTDKVARWSIEDLSTILSMDMLSEFAQTPNVKKKTAIGAAVNKYGKATMVVYGLLISTITSQLAMTLYK